jgi:hypothetical protein
MFTLILFQNVVDYLVFTGRTWNQLEDGEKLVDVDAVDSPLFEGVKIDEEILRAVRRYHLRGKDRQLVI